MRENLGKIFDNQVELSDMENKSGNLKNDAAAFNLTSQKLE